MIHAKNFGWAAGIVWGLSMFITTLVSLFTGYASNWLALMSNVYPGYTVSWGGSIVGLIYGLVEGFVAFGLLAWIYNKLGSKKKRK